MKRLTLVTRSSMPPIDEYIDEIKELWDTHWITNMGIKHDALKEQLSKYLDVENIELFVNGHMALEMAIQSYGFPIGGEVITTPYTFVSTVHAIVRNGLMPVFCDIKDDFCIDESLIEGLITDKTCAILPVHVYGHTCNIDRIEQIAAVNNLKVIYDAAHAFGVTYKGRGIGSYGDASVFSFHATKVFNTIEGGAICYSDELTGRSVRNLRNFGIQDEENVTAIGANAKMNEFCAAMGICNLRHIDEEIEKRKRVVERYNNNLKGSNKIKIYEYNTDSKHNYGYYPIIIQDDCGVERDELYQLLIENGIKARKYFYPIVSEMQCYRNRYNSSDTPKALSISKHILTLPLYADLDYTEIDRICGIILDM